MIKIFSDGACSGNPGPGGWAAVIITNKTSYIAGYEEKTTNNRMELKAAIEGLKSCVGADANIIIYTDSTYLKDGITKWMYAWKKNNWKNGTVKNIDLWTELEAVLQKLPNVKWEWVKAHSGVEYNEMADELARNQIKLHTL